jgi:hypothetical protein
MGAGFSRLTRPTWKWLPVVEVGLEGASKGLQKTVMLLVTIWPFGGPEPNKTLLRVAITVLPQVDRRDLRMPGAQKLSFPGRPTAWSPLFKHSGSSITLKPKNTEQNSVHSKKRLNCADLRHSVKLSQPIGNEKRVRQNGAIYLKWQVQGSPIFGLRYLTPLVPSM